MESFAKLIMSVFVMICILVVALFYGGVWLVERGYDEVVDAVSSGTPRADARKAEEDREKQQVEDDRFQEELAEHNRLRLEEERQTPEQRRWNEAKLSPDEKADKEWFKVSWDFFIFARKFEASRKKSTGFYQVFGRNSYRLSLHAPYTAIMDYGASGQINFHSYDGKSWKLVDGWGKVWDFPKFQAEAPAAADAANRR
jgi:hypothetical protein